MTAIESVREVIYKNFQNISDVGDGIIRGERHHEGKAFAVAYVDFSDNVIARSTELDSFQERLVGEDFFSTDNDLRWNSYLFFWAGPRSKSHENFLSAKSEIESDRHFARKMVLDEDELKRQLGTKAVHENDSQKKGIDVVDTWSEQLRANSLAILLEQGPRTRALELIESGDAFKIEMARSNAESKVFKDDLATGFVREINIDQFRRVHNHREFEFGDVNLIVGPNGKGKTSLLEAIEVLYCGNVRRELKASYKGIVGKIETPDGKSTRVEATADTTTLKARNMAWYGRTDVKGSAISQGFTRFNFLDTDAAFRLASETDPEQIQLELAQLLVGPDTSRLWTFLSKLKDDVEVALKGVNQQRSGLLLTIELLNEQIAGLKNSPSQASVLRKNFRESVRLLRPSWEVPDDEETLSVAEQGALLGLLNAAERAIASSNETPVTEIGLTKSFSDAEAFGATVRRIHSDYESAVRKTHSVATAIFNRLRSKETVEQWYRVLNAGIPDLSQRLDKFEAESNDLLAILQSHQATYPHFIPHEYYSIPLSAAIIAARNAHDIAKEGEQNAALALSQAQQIEQTLDALRQDLYDAAKSYMERSGDSVFCPVCKTEHGADVLSQKLQMLLPSSTTNVAGGLRHSHTLAAERSEGTRRTLSALQLLEKYRASINASIDATPAYLHSDKESRRERLQVVSEELKLLRNEIDELESMGFDFSAWRKFRDEVASILSADVRIDELTEISRALEKLKAQLALDERDKATADAEVQQLLGKAKQLAAEKEMIPASDFSIASLVAFAERAAKRAEVGLEAMREIIHVLPIKDDVSLNAVQSQLEACLLSFDKAIQALRQEKSIYSELSSKELDLRSETNKLVKNQSSSANLAKALTCLSNIVDNHSLERATSETFEAIRGRVSDIFAKIHSPAEYTLGSFSDGQLIVRCDDDKPHDVNQISTGQRAALALSIFLALNESATTAPPVILIDDPVAHIDDLNALSFLDYLREVVVTQRRQVFFATADARLAALFQRKFEFLGTQKFKRIDLSRAHHL